MHASKGRSFFDGWWRPALRGSSLLLAAQTEGEIFLVQFLERAVRINRFDTLVQLVSEFLVVTLDSDADALADPKLPNDLEILALWPAHDAAVDDRHLLQPSVAALRDKVSANGIGPVIELYRHILQILREILEAAAVLEH